MSELDRQDAIAAAFQEGHEAAENLAVYAGDCPYQHNQSLLRMAWMDGFSAGRVKAKSQHLVGFLKNN